MCTSKSNGGLERTDDADDADDENCQMGVNEELDTVSLILSRPFTSPPPPSRRSRTNEARFRVWYSNNVEYFACPECHPVSSDIHRHHYTFPTKVR
jgi:hypothetical protein